MKKSKLVKKLAKKLGLEIIHMEMKHPKPSKLQGLPMVDDLYGAPGISKSTTLFNIAVDAQMNQILADNGITTEADRLEDEHFKGTCPTCGQPDHR